jgi:hypothetical protein
VTSQPFPSHPAAKLGAALFVLWSVLHIWVGAEGIRLFVGEDITGLWAMLTGGAAAPRDLVQVPTDALTINAHLRLLLNFTVDVAGYGVLGLMVAWLIWFRASWLGYGLGLVIIGIADLTFTYAMLLSGVIEPNLPTVAGPVIWLLAVLVTPFGLRRAALS